VFDARGWVWKSSLVAAVKECEKAGANVVNMSLGGGGFSQFENDAFQRMTDNNMLLIAAAGNDGNTAYSYPASYPMVVSGKYSASSASQCMNECMRT